MTYVLIGILLVLVAGGFITFVVLRSTERSAAAGDPSADNRTDRGLPGIGLDETPLADTAEHAGEQDDQGRTVAPADAEHEPGEPPAGPPAPGRVQRDPVGGEAEARPYQEVPRAE
jgi:hypothetical protein